MRIESLSIHRSPPLLLALRCLVCAATAMATGYGSTASPVGQSTGEPKRVMQSIEWPEGIEALPLASGGRIGDAMVATVLLHSERSLDAERDAIARALDGVGPVLRALGDRSVPPWRVVAWSLGDALVTLQWHDRSAGTRGVFAIHAFGAISADGATDPLWFGQRLSWSTERIGNQRVETRVSEISTAPPRLAPRMLRALRRHGCPEIRVTGSLRPNRFVFRCDTPDETITSVVSDHRSTSRVFMQRVVRDEHKD